MENFNYLEWWPREVSGDPPIFQAHVFVTMQTEKAFEMWVPSERCNRGVGVEAGGLWVGWGGCLSPALHSALPLGPGPKELGVLSWGNLERLVGIRSHQRPTQTQLPLPTDTKSGKPRATMACQASPSTLSRILNSPTLGGSRGLDTPFTETARFVVDFLVPMRTEGESVAG